MLGLWPFVVFEYEYRPHCLAVVRWVLSDFFDDVGDLVPVSVNREVYDETDSGRYSKQQSFKSEPAEGDT